MIKRTSGKSLGWSLLSAFFAYVVILGLFTAFNGGDFGAPTLVGGIAITAVFGGLMVWLVISHNRNKNK